MADPNSPYSQLDHEALNKQSVYDPSSVVERLRVASQKHEARIKQRELENIEGLKRLQAKKEEQKSFINQIGSLGTDSDAVRTLAGSAVRGASDAALGTLAWGAEALAQATDNPNLAESADSLREKNEGFVQTSNSILESRNLDVLKAVAESTPTGDLDKPETWSMGNDPSAKGYGYQMLGILGEFAPQAAGLLAKSPKMAATIMGGIGAGQAGTAQGREARDYVLSQDISTLQEDSEAFREMLADNPGMSPDDAKQQLAELAGLSAFGAGAAVGGAGGVATGYILKSLPKVLEGNRVTRMGKTGTLSGVEEGTQEVGEGAAATLASSAVTGLEQDPLEGSFGEAVLGAGFGTGLGTAGGAVNEVERKVQELDTANQERLAKEREQNVGVISAINEGRFDDLINPENREQFPRTTVATALGKVAMDNAVDAEARQKANEALATLETEAAQELQVEQERLQANGTLKTLKKEEESTKKKIERLEAHITEKTKAGESEESLAGFQAMLEQMRDNDLPAIQGQIDQANQSDGKRVKTLQDELTSIGELRRNATVETTRSTDVAGLMSQAMDVSSTPEVRSQSNQQLVSTVRSNPDALNADQLKQLASPNNTALNDSDRKFLRQLAAAKVQENSLKSMDDVASDIYKDQGSRGYISLPKYKSLVGAAMQKGDVDGARQSLSMLENFMVDHAAKADNARKALKVAQETGKQQALVADRSAEGGWMFRDKGRLWTDMKLKENGGLSIHRSSENLVNKIAKEAQVIASTHAALKAAVEGADVTPSQSTSDTPAQPEAVSEAPDVTPTDASMESADAQSESQTAKATNESPARTEEPAAGTDPVTERTDTTSEPVSTVLTGRVMKGTDPSTLKPVVLAKVHQQVATKFGELQRQAYQSGQVPAELATYRNDLRLIAQTVMKDSPASLAEFFELLVSSDTGVTQSEIFAWAKNYASNEAQLDLLDRQEKHPLVQGVDRVFLYTQVSTTPMGVTFKPSAAFFPDETMTLGYDPSMVSSHGNSVEFVVDGIIHENNHAVSYDLINSDPVLRQEIKDISGIIGDWLQDDTNRQKLSDPTQFEYAISDPNQQELLSTLLGSPRLTAELQLIPDPDGKQTLLDKFMSALKTAIQKAFPGITPKEVSLLDRVLRLGDEVFENSLFEGGQAIAPTPEPLRNGQTQEEVEKQYPGILPWETPEDYGKRVNEETKESIPAVPEKVADTSGKAVTKYSIKTLRDNIIPEQGTAWSYAEVLKAIEDSGFTPVFKTVGKQGSGRYRVTVASESLEIKGFLMAPHKEGTKWEVSSLDTGMNAVRGADTKAQAIAGATQRFEEASQGVLDNIARIASELGYATLRKNYLAQDGDRVTDTPPWDVEPVAETPKTETNIYADTISKINEQFLATASTKQGAVVTESLKSEMMDVGVLMDMLGLDFAVGTVGKAPSEAEVAKLQKRLTEIYSEVVADPDSLDNYRTEIERLASGWFTAPAEFYPAGTETSEAYSNREARALKSAEKYGDGNPTANLLIQLAEELGEVIEESNLANPGNATIPATSVEAQKRAFKAIRFREDTKIKPSKKPDATAEDNKYVGLTNKEAFEQAFAEYQNVKTASSPVYWFQGAELAPIDGQMTYDEIRSPINKMAYFTVSNNRALTKERDFLTSTLNRAKGDLSVLAPFIRGGTERLEKLAQKEDLNEYLDTVLSHMQAFNKQIDALFVNSPDKDKFGNPLSYLADPKTGKLDENTKTAISQAALSFVLENGNEVWSNGTDRQLRSVLHLNETEQVDRYAKRVVMNAGRRQASVIQELGRKAYQASGLKLLPNAPQNEAQQITNAMGEMALAVLFSKTEASKLPYMQRYEIPNYAFDKDLREKVRSTNLNIRGSKNHKSLNKQEAELYRQYLAKHYFVRSNRLMDENTGTEFTKNNELEQLKELARGTQNFLDDVFGVEYTRILPTLKPVDFEQKKAKNSPGSVPSELAKAVDTDNKRAIKLDADLLSTEEGQVGIFHRMSRELIGLIAGKEDTTGRAIHKVNRDGIRGKNEAIDREISLLLDDTLDLVEGDVNTPFYTQKTVWKMHRVGHSSNGFNAQNSKLHRYSAHLEGWEYAVNTKDPSDHNHQEFKLALLDALGVKTDDASPAKVAARFETEILGNETLMAAVPVMSRLLTDQDFALNDAQSPEAQTLLTAINEAGEGAHSLAGLKNLVQYLEAKKGSGVFTSTLSREGDGKNNGPIISNLMMGLPADRAEQNELMNMGGLFTSGQKYKNYGEYAEKVGKDLYKRLASRANEGMQTRVNGIDKPEEFLPLRLLHTVIGNFVDEEGNVTKAGRTAVKQPLTSMIFGAGVQGTIDNMADDFVLGIYTLFEQAHNDPRQTQALVKGLNEVMEFANRGRKRPMSPSVFTLNPNQRNFLNHEFSDAQETLLASVFHEFMGGEIKTALEEQYGEFLQTRSAMNDAANMTFRYYNLAYQEERKKLLAEIQAKTGNDYQDLTAEQEKELTKRVSKLFPMMHTAFSKASGQSHRYGLPLLKQRRVQADEGKQYTTTTKFKGLAVPSYRGINDTGRLEDVKSLKAEGVKYEYVEPGAGTVVLATHSTDTYPAASVYSKFSALNSHDAVHGPAPMMPEMIQHMNKSFFDAMVNVSITENIMDALFRTMDEFSVWEADFVEGMSSADRQAWENTKAWEIAPREREYAKDGSFIELPSDLTPEEHAREWLDIAADADRNRLAFLSRVGLVSQYYVGGGDFKVSGKQRQDLREKLEKRDLVKVITDRRAQRLTRDPVLMLEEMDKLQASVTEAMMDKASKIDPEDALILDRLNSALNDAQGNLNIALGMVFPGPMARDVRDHWRKVVTGTLGKRLYLEYTGQLSEVRQQAQPKQLAQYRSGSSSNVKNYTTQEVLGALGKQDNLNPGQSQRLSAVMASVVNNLHGPFGAKKAAVEAKSGETPVDLLIRSEQEGVYPFTSKASISGLKLTASERFVMEQVELTMRDAFDGKSMADKEIVKLFREARSTIKPQDLYAGDWSKATQAEMDAAKQAHDFIFRLDTDIGDTRSTHLSRFVALGLTYPPLQQALDFPLETVPSLKGEKAGDYLMYGFERVSQRAGDEINKTYSGQRANQRMEALVTRLVYNEKKQKLNILKQMDDVVEQLESATESAREAVKEKVLDTVNNKALTENKYRTIRTGTKLTAILAEDRADELLKTLENFRNYEFRKKPLGFFMSTLNEVRGETTETEGFYEALAKVGQIEQERKNILENLRKEVLERFEDYDSLTDKEKAAVTQLFLRTDISALQDSMKSEEILGLLEDDAKMGQKIQALTKEVVTNNRFAGYHMTAIKDLAYYLATGKNVSENLAFNAHNIANLYGTNKARFAQSSDALVKSIDQLTSLYAFKYSDGAHKQAIRSLFQREKMRGGQNGLVYLMTFHKGMKADAQKELFGDNPTQMMKGYTKEIYNPHTQVVTADWAEGEKLIARGYERKSLLEMDDADPEKHKKGQQYLYVIRDAGLQDYVTGVLSNTGMQAKGSEINRGTNVGNAEGLTNWKEDRVQRVHRKKAKAADEEMFDYRADYDPSKRKAGKLAPVFDDQGNVANYRYLMEHKTKDALLDRDNRFEDILASTAASQYDKLASAEHNREVIGALYDFYKQDYAGNVNAFVEVSEDSSDPRLREAYRLLPDATREAVQMAFGQDKLFIRNDMLDLILGYRKHSMSTWFNRDANENNVAQNFLVDLLEGIYGKKAALQVRQAEDMWQATVKLVKDVWVIRNFTTLLGNVISNTTLLLAYGVPARDIISGHREAIDGLLRYQATRNKLLRVQANQKAKVGNADALAEQVRELEFDLQRNPVHELVNAGMFQTIMEDIDAEKDEYKYLNKFDRTLEDWAGKLPEPVRKTGEVLTVGHNTTLYKMLFKGTQMSDFVGRYVLYNHLSNRKSKPLTKDQVMKRTREAFVNYDVPSHRGLQYANDMGLVFFTKYYMRIQKVIWGIMQESPARALGVVAASNYLGGIQHIFNSSAIQSVGDNPFDVGALNITDITSEPLPLKMLLSFLD